MMGYKILGYIVWHGAKRYMLGGTRRAKKDLVIAGAGAGALLLAGAGAAVASKRGNE
jgi:hypothetical protein